MGRLMWDSIPDEADLKPKLVGRRKQRLLEFSNHSWYQSDSAKEFESGRGLTLHSLHVSEVAFFADAQRKLTGLLQAVPNEPGTLIVLESTANGANYFKDLWDSAAAGESDYIAFFSPWFHETAYQRRFANEAELEDFRARVGEGSVGEDEPDLQAQGLSLEQLHWRRWVIRNNFAGDLDRFKQEFPASPAEAFMTSGRLVFGVSMVRRAQQAAEKAAKPESGTLEPTGLVTRRSRGVLVEVPTGVEFKPRPIDDDRRPGWLVWEHPGDHPADEPAGQYIIGVDASGGDERNGVAAYHAVEVVNHRTKVQAAEYRSRIDPDQLAFEIYLACLYFNQPWAAVEVTGSWGGPAARRLKFDFRYPFTYQRPALEAAHLRTEDRLGWDTNRVSKAHLESGAMELLREDTHGIRSKGLALEIGWYVRDPRNRSGPEPGKWSDRLMAWMIAQEVAREKHPRSPGKPAVTSTLAGASLNPKTGYRY
jgi:hypothetical protein